MALSLGAESARGGSSAAARTVDPPPSAETGASVAFMTPRGVPRIVDFETDEGTLMSVDIAPHGDWIVFDLLGHIYRMPARGGRAEVLTQGTGVALNYHPRVSPDGHSIAFVSDRSGQANIWIMASDGSQARPVFLDRDHMYAMPIWSPDGKSLVATRYAPTAGLGWFQRNAAAWELPLTGVPRPLLQSATAQYYATSFSPDGSTLHFYTSTMEDSGASIFEIDWRIGELDIKSGGIQVTPQLPTVVPDQDATAIGTKLNTRPVAGVRLAEEADASVQAPVEIAPLISPDGQYLAFARSEPHELMTFRGHSYAPRTALFVRNLRTKTERKVLDPITKDLTNSISIYPATMLPGYAWSGDSRELVISAGGKIVRVSIDGSSVRTVPFQAHVRRLLSEQVRRQSGLDPDGAVPVRFIQWPAASPDGRKLVFAALGRLWLMELPHGAPKPLTPDPGSDVQITPAWSPDGARIVFASWNEKTRGQLWVVDVTSGALTQISADPGEYIWPTWLPERASVVAVLGPGSADSRDAWDATDGWKVVRLHAGSTEATTLALAGSPRQPLQVGSDNRIYSAKQWSTSGAPLYLAYPDPVKQELYSWVLMSVDADGKSPRAHLTFPPGPSAFNVPVPSGDGKWLAYQTDYQVFVEPVGITNPSVATTYIDPNPNRRPNGRLRADESGGVYPRWHDSHTLEFASGNRYIRYDVNTGDRSTIDVKLTFARDSAPGTTVLRHARIITMDGKQVIQNGALTIRGGRFTCVGTCEANSSDRVIDLNGATVIPGLIDVHEHITNSTSGIVSLRRPRSLLALAYGVTTIVDPATSSTTLFPLGEMTEVGRALGPRAVGSAEPEYASVGGERGAGAIWQGELLDIMTPEDANYQVSRRANWGAVITKNYLQTRREQQQWLIDASRAHDLSVTSEGSSLVAQLSMVMDGQTGWEHFIDAIPLYGDVSKFIGRAGANYSPTLGIAGAPEGATFYYRPRADLPHDPKYSRFASAAVLNSVRPRESAPPPLTDFAFPLLAEGVADVIHNGGHATIGEHGNDPGIGSHWEMWAYSTALKPMEVLRMATIEGARLVGLERDIGSLTVGKRADLVVLLGNPLERIEETADIQYIMKSGRLYDGQTLEEIVPKRATAGE